MPSLPTATTTLTTTAGAPATGDDLLVVIGCAASNTGTPIIYSSAAAMYAAHGYCEAVEYAAQHIRDTRKPIMFVPVPIVTEGEVVAASEDTAGNTNTCVTTLTEGAGGCLHEHDGVLTVIQGGTIGTDQIILGLSLDGGRTAKRVRLGTGNSYVIPYVGVTIAFAAGDLTAGETIHTWHATSPKWNSAGIVAARNALAAQQVLARTWLVLGTVTDATTGGYVVTAANAYASSNERFIVARVDVADHVEEDTTLALWEAGLADTYETIASEQRVNLGAGRARVQSAFSGWLYRRGFSWHASIREYQHDVHVTTWWKKLGPLAGVTITDEDGQSVEHDERTGTSLLPYSFSCLRTYSNSNGVFVAMDLTREDENDPLAYHHNMNVANVAQTVVQRVTENFIGQTPLLSGDGKTLDKDDRAALADEVNEALSQALLSDLKGEGRRASGVKYTPATDDDLSVPGATLNSETELNLRGTIVNIVNKVKVG
jgi:hypothetical protein